MVNLSLLQLFVKVAETGSIAAAARQLDIAPSIASRQIATLEHAFKTKLLIRTTRHLSLTQAGHTLLEWAKPTTRSFEELTDELGAMQHRPSGVVRIASNDYASAKYLPDILKKFCRKYPDVRVQLSTSTEPARLLDGEYDLALHAGRMPDVNLIGRKVRQYRRCLCASSAYLARKGTPQKVSDLAEHDCLTHSPGERLNWSFEHKGQIITQAIQPYIEVDSYEVLRQLAVSGMGIARLSESMVQEASRAANLLSCCRTHLRLCRWRTAGDVDHLRRSADPAPDAAAGRLSRNRDGEDVICPSKLLLRCF